MTRVDVDALENSCALIVVLDPEGRIQHWTRACTHLFGYDLSEVRGRPILELCCDDPSNAAFGGPHAQRLPSLAERRCTNKRGIPLTIAWSNCPVLGPEGEVERILAIGLDITVLSRERDSAQGRLAALLEQAPDGIFVADLDGRYTDVNRAGCRLLGHTREEIVGKTIMDLIPPQDVQRLFKSKREMLAGSNHVAEWQLRRKDGTYVAVEVSAAILPDGRWQGFVRDITARKAQEAERERAAEAIRANERLLNAIFDILPVGIWIADSTGRVIRTNEAGIQIWGGVRFVGISEFDQFKGWWADSGEPIATEDWALVRALVKGESSVGELIRIERFDGKIKTVLNSALPLRDEKGEPAGAIAVNEDITHLREIEDALRHAVHSRDEVLGIVAHDLRNPLSAIMLQLDLLREHDSERDPRDRKPLEAIRRQTLRLNRLIQDLLDMTSIDAGALSVASERVDAQELVAEAGERLLPAGSTIEIRVQVQGDLPKLCGDRGRLLQVFDNLIGNAVKFTQPGGRITLGAVLRDGEVVFSVADTGKGVPPESLPHLFDRFWQATRVDRRGAGLGLAIVKGIVEAHGGHVWVESKLGSGTTFFFTIPLAGRAQFRPSRVQPDGAAR